MPFDVATRDGVLTLTLDTPGSPINIFNHATAHQLIELLSTVSASTTRAVVFRTAKPNSFINGVGLLLAQASQTADDIARASTPAWTAYRAVRAAPVPTIAVVQGSCFGCGVEFELNCDYRIATDSFDTQFYMTELNDYLFIPLFGSTWNLPAAVGLSDAIDLLLWGERWGAARAVQRGLIDAVVADEEVGPATDDFVARLLQGEEPSRRRGRVRWSEHEDRVVEQTRHRIALLPPQYHKVYTDALELLVAGALQKETYERHQKRELACSADSALSAVGKAAYGFFYLRQMASERAAGRIRGSDAVRMTLAVDDGRNAALQTFGADLRSRKLAGVTFTSAADADLRLVAAAESGNGSVASGSARTESNSTANDHRIAVRIRPALEPTTPAEIYAPTYPAGGRLLELATRAAGESTVNHELLSRLTRVLQRLGFEIARTAPTDSFVSNRLLLGYLRPLLRHVQSSGDVSAANAQLRLAGFVRLPHDVVAGIEREALAAQLAPRMALPTSAAQSLLAALDSGELSQQPAGEDLIDALCLSLVDAARTALARREVRDASVVDLIAREMLDFPRAACSLCVWLKRDRVARALSAGAAVRQLVDAAVWESAEAFVAAGREFYR